MLVFALVGEAIDDLLAVSLAQNDRCKYFDKISQPTRSFHFFFSPAAPENPGRARKHPNRNANKPGDRRNVFALSPAAESEGLLPAVNPGVALVAQAAPAALRDIFTASQGAFAAGGTGLVN
jgi:hypothetical protein